jgi:hypothetical protein
MNNERRERGETEGARRATGVSSIASPACPVGIRVAPNPEGSHEGKPVAF